MLRAAVQRDWYLIEVVDRILDKGIVFEAIVWGPDGPEMGPVTVVRPPDDDDDGGDDGSAQQMRVKRPKELTVVGASRSR